MTKDLIGDKPTNDGRLNQCPYAIRETTFGGIVYYCQHDGTMNRKKGSLACQNPGAPTAQVNECAENTNARHGLSGAKNRTSGPTVTSVSGVNNY